MILSGMVASALKLIFALALLVLLPPLTAFQRLVVRPPADSSTAQRIDPTQLNAAISLSSNYVKRASRQTGAFIYSVDTETERVPPLYGIVRFPCRHYR